MDWVHRPLRQEDGGHAYLALRQLNDANKVRELTGNRKLMLCSPEKQVHSQFIRT
jgi:hypothetical protein